MAKPLTNCLKAVTEKTTYTYNKKDCNGYMLTMWLSHDSDLVGICNRINPHIFNLTDEMIYKYFRKAVPCKSRYLKWTKKTKESEANENEVKELMEQYDISSREAKLSLRVRG